MNPADSVEWMRRVRWKNPPALPGQPYQPTRVEHIANILTHGVISAYNTLHFHSPPPKYSYILQLYLFPVIYRCWVDLISVKTTSPDKAWACLVYGLVTIGLFGVSTLFHVIFCANGNHGLLKHILHRYALPV